MELPSYKKKMQRKLKICREPDCGKQYWGHPVSKYCDLHQDIRNRQKPKKVFEEPGVKNQIFVHNFKEETEVEFTCHLPGCPVKYAIPIHPKLYVYPKYCPEHRNEFKRELFLRQRVAA